VSEPKLLTKVVHRHFGSAPKGAEPQGGGLNNSVFAVDHHEGQFVVRFGGDDTSLDTFQKESWAIEKAREHGVPAAPILHVGEEDGQPYMVMELVDGTLATEFAESLEIIEELGHWAAEIHKIETAGFGHVFDWADDKHPRSPDWTTYLRKELRLEDRLNVLQRNEMLTRPQIEELRSTLDSIADLKLPTRLNHGDLRLKNLLVNDTGKILAIIDWEFCTSNFTPLWDLSITLHDLSIDQKGAFLKGYGLDEETLVALNPAIRALNTINYAPFIDQAAQEGDEEQLQNFRLRLSGALDLYPL
jgi:hygromycin-B 4-O-kinase